MAGEVIAPKSYPYPRQTIPQPPRQSAKDRIGVVDEQQSPWAADRVVN